MLIGRTDVATLVRVLSPNDVLAQVDDRWDPPVHMAKDQKVDYFIGLPQDLTWVLIDR